VTTANGTRIAGIAATSYTHSGLTNGTAYYYVVTAVNASGESTPSTQVSATPSAPPPPPVGAALRPPAGPTATAGNAQVSLSWTASTGATSYNIYFGTSAGVTTANGTRIAGIAATSYTHSGLTNGTAYYYVVTAVNASGESAPSTQVSATPSAPPPPPVGAALQPPAGPTATAGNAQVSLSWTASTGATSYNIYFGTSAGVTTANGTRIAGITATSYTHSGLTNGTAYYYVVTAVNASGESAPSTQVSATPTALLEFQHLLMMTPH